MNVSLKLFGPRVLLKKEKPSKKGALFIPDNPHQIHSIARVMVVGDGRARDGSVTPMIVSVGELVYFQTNAMLAAACSYELDGDMFISLMQGDLLARLPDLDITLEKMEMLNDWSLVKPYVKQRGAIIIPDTVNYQEHLEHTYWNFVKAAPGSDLPVQVGQEVLVNAHRASPVQIGEEIYCYIDRQFILGVCDPTPVETVATATA